MKTGRYLLRVLTVAVWVTCSSTSASAVTQLVSCGMVVEGEVELPADLDCSSQPLPSVLFGATGSLALNGHTLIGEVRAGADVLTILGPGTITGPGDGVYNVGATVSSRVKVVGADIVNNEGEGIVAVGSAYNSPASVSVTDGSVSGNGGVGIAADSGQRLPWRIPRSPITLLRSRVDGNGACGLISPHFILEDSSVSGNGDCGLLITAHSQKSIRIKRSNIDANVGAAIVSSSQDWGSGQIKIRDATLIGNALGIDFHSYKVDGGLYNNWLVLKRTVIQNNDHGLRVTADRVRVVSSDISGNRIAGISFRQLSGKRLAVADTTVTGNGTSADCGATVVCADLDTDLAPRLDPRSTCDTSHVYGSGLPGSSWGLCALD